MLNLIDDYLNKTTMYRLVLYCLFFLEVVAAILSALKILPYNFFALVGSALFLVVACWLVNEIFAFIFEAPINVESVYITALILALILTPAKNVHDFIFLFWAGSLAIGSKFILAIGKKHIFNPVAIAVAITAFTLNQSALWWVSTPAMLPFVLITGFLIIRKIRRWDLFFAFLLTALYVTLTVAFFSGKDVVTIAKQCLFETPLFFLGFIMLTEPLTTPPTANLQISYGMLVGFLFSPQIHFGTFYFTPELALLVGNLYSYVVSPKTKLLLTLKEKIRRSPDIIDFVFSSNKTMAFAPGQYLEWTLAHKSPDNRGNRRYFTIASSPTEKEVILGAKFYPSSSSFKRSLWELRSGQNIVAGQLAGDFTLPGNPDTKLVFIAGGIGITPFRSMVKYLLDTGQRRDIVLFYSAKSPHDLAYKELFDSAGSSIGMRNIYVVNNPSPLNLWDGEVGWLNEDIIRRNLPDFRRREFYLSGPRSMVDFFEETLQDMGVDKKHIKTDFFPGFV